MERLTAIIHGKIQGVGYRSRVVTIAKAFGLKGCIQNLPDGSVKVIAEGDRSDLERFLNAINVRNALIKVEKVDHGFSQPCGDFSDFYKLVGEGETDERLDKAAEYLKELIVVTRNGFGEMKRGFDEVKAELRQGFDEIRNVIVEESQKTTGKICAVIREESELTRQML